VVLGGTKLAQQDMSWRARGIRDSNFGVLLDISGVQG
jgi:hypothetical protein